VTAREAAPEYEQFVRNQALDPEQELAFRAATLLLARERGEPLWKRWSAIELPEEDEGDLDAIEERGRMVALKRFARRMEEGDVAAWMEVLQTEFANEEMPFGFAFDFGVEDGSQRIHVSAGIPGEDVVSAIQGVTKQRAFYLDVCCGLILRLAHEVYRVIPEADDLVITGYREGYHHATGSAGKVILLKCATDRESFAQLNLDGVDPSAAFEHLGGVTRTNRGRLMPLGFELAADS
jgi:hypothetical protein